MPIQSTETNAPDKLAELIPALTRLTLGKPPTDEIKEAHQAAKDITRLLVEWLADRYTTEAAARKAYSGNDAIRAIAARPEIDYFDVAMDEFSEDIQRTIDARCAALEAPGIAEREAVAEAQRVDNAHVAPFFCPALEQVQRVS
jgi:hypothetical protein